MSRTANSTSAYDAFPAQEFDAWIDKLRHTIIDGLEEPEVEVPPLTIPNLSDAALETVRQAEKKAAVAEAEAKAREEQVRAAAEQEAEKRSEDLRLRDALERQLEEEQQEYDRQARSQQERETQRLENYRQQSSEEERERLSADENATAQYDGQNDQDDEYMEDQDGEGTLPNSQVINETNPTDWNRGQQEVIDDSEEDVAEIQPLPELEYDYDHDEVTREKDVFEYPDVDTEQQSPRSEQSQPHFELSGLAEEQEEEFEEEYEEGSQSAGDAVSETATMNGDRAQGFREAYSLHKAQNAEFSESEQDVSQYDEEDGTEDQDEIGNSPSLVREHTEEWERGSDEAHQDPPELASQSNSRLYDSRQPLGLEDNAIEIADDSSEDQGDDETRSTPSGSGSHRSQHVDAPYGRAGHEERESSGEAFARAGGDGEGQKTDSEEEPEKHPLRNGIRPLKRPSEYDLVDEQSEGGEEYGGSDIEGEDQDVNSQYSYNEADSVDPREHLQTLSEDELAAEEGEEEEEGNFSAPGDVEQSEYWRPSRTAQIVMREDTIAEIDPALASPEERMEPQMVQVSSRGLAIGSLTQMAHLSASRSLDSIVPDIGAHVNQAVTSPDPPATVISPFERGTAYQTEPFEQADPASLPKLDSNLNEEVVKRDDNPSISLQSDMHTADFAVKDTALTRDVTAGVPTVPRVPLDASVASPKQEDVARDQAQDCPPSVAFPSEGIINYDEQRSPEQLREPEDVPITNNQDSMAVHGGNGHQHQVLTQEHDSDYRDVDMASAGDVSSEESFKDTRADQDFREGEEDSEGVDDDDRTSAESVERGQSESGEEASDIPVPEPDGYSNHEQDRARFPSAFDRQADFVRLTTPSKDEDDELEDGEIRDDDERSVQSPEEDHHGEVVDVPNETPVDQLGGSNADENLAVEGMEVELDLEVNLPVGVVVNREGSEEPDENSLGDLPETENPDGIRRGGADVMGSRQEGVRVDEIVTLEEDDKDSQQDPDYSADESESAEDIQYGEDDVAPLPLQPEGEIDEVDPDDLRGLREEIRSHNRSDIPHKNDHLLEEDEEYDDDEPEHHVDGRPPGYDSYSVLDETDPNDLEVFQVAERDHSGIKGSRTIEQMSLQEMDSRRQPGDAAEDITTTQHAQSVIANQKVMPSQPSINDIHSPRNQISDSTAAQASETTSDSRTIEPVVNISGLALDKQSESGQSEASPKVGNDGTTEVADDIFPVDPPLTVDVSGEVPTNHDAIVDVLHSSELPPAPQQRRSPSPLAPEAELQHDLALAMEPAPLLHRHDRHHNVVWEESHRLHEEKVLSFTSAMDAVEESASSVPRKDQSSQISIVAETAGTNEMVLDQPARIGPLTGSPKLQPNLPTTPSRDSAQAPSQIEGENHDDGDDPLLLSERFVDGDLIIPPNPLNSEVYVDVPPLDRSHPHEVGLDSEVEIEVEQRVEPTTPPISATSSIDPTRHHHGPVHRTSYTSIRSEENDISGSPAAHTRSQCHYHKIRFGRGVFSHVLLIPHCSIGSEAAREKVGARDMGRVTKEEMLHKRDLNLGDTFTHKMTSDVETLPDDLEHLVRQLIGPDLLREGHIWLLPLGDVASQSTISRSLEGSDGLGNDDVFHVRREASQTPERKRKRGSSRARSTSTGRSDVHSPELVSKRTRSRSRAGVFRKVSQIDEKEEESPEMAKEDATEQSGSITEDKSVEASMRLQSREDETDAGQVKQDAKVGQEVPETAGGDGDQLRSEKRSIDDYDDGNRDEQDEDGHAAKKRIVQREDSDGRDAIEVRPVQKAGWLSWLFGKRS